MFASGVFCIVVGIALFQNSSAYNSADDLGTVIFANLVIIQFSHKFNVCLLKFFRLYFGFFKCFNFELI